MYTLGPQNPWANSAISSPKNMGQIISKNEGFGFPWSIYIYPGSPRPNKEWSLGSSMSRIPDPTEGQSLVPGGDWRSKSEPDAKTESLTPLFRRVQSLLLRVYIYMYTWNLFVLCFGFFFTLQKKAFYNQNKINKCHLGARYIYI